ncbi:MAG: FAD:protein FMN transferase [Pirellulales bacterium]|nr:FAD:protein FMN transferase [Pirellulales bacterium]
MPTGDPSRRDFLTGRAAERAARGAVNRALGRDDIDSLHRDDLRSSSADSKAEAFPGIAHDAYLLRYSTTAMACEFEVAVPAENRSLDAAATAEPPALQALALVEQLENQMTVYRSDSELAQINQRAATEAIIVEPKLFALLKQCKTLAEKTQGAFDITSTPLTRVWGFHRREGRIPSDVALSEARSIIGWQHLVLDEESMSVRFEKAGLELNLGAIGKGFALDRCGELMREHGESCFLWHAGQSSVLATGDQPSQPTGSGWPITIGNPLKPGKPLGTLRVANVGVATSGSSQQFFRHEGQRYGHVIDPRTGKPASGVLSVTVMADTAAEADALATAFSILGPARAEEYCQARPTCGFVMLARDRDESPFRLRIAGRAEEHFALEPGVPL